MDPELYFTGNIANLGVRVSGGVVKGLVHLEVEVLFGGCCCHVGCNRVYSGEHGCVNGSGIILEEAKKLLYCFMMSRRDGRVGRVVDHLLLLAVLWRGIWVWRVLWFGWSFMPKAMSCFGDVVGYG